MLKGRDRDIQQARLRRATLPSWPLDGLELQFRDGTGDKMSEAGLVRGLRQTAALQPPLRDPRPGFQLSKAPETQTHVNSPGVKMSTIKKTTPTDQTHAYRQCLTYQLPFCQLWPGDFQINQRSHIHSFIHYLQEL